MRGASIGIRKVAGVILIAIWAPSPTRPASLLAQDSNPHWVPFVAKLVQKISEPMPGGGSVRAAITGAYVRNSQGASFTRRVVSTHSDLPVVGALDTAFLNDRPNRTIYGIDFVNKTIKQESAPSGKPEFAVEPPSRADFDRQHAADLFLGKQQVSGVECEGYKLADPRHKGKYRGEGWFAPSLSFLAVRYIHRLPNGRETTILVENLEPGKEPDPRFFILPKDFRWLK
jgi:hypothetical protein